MKERTGAEIFKSFENVSLMDRLPAKDRKKIITSTVQKIAETDHLLGVFGAVMTSSVLLDDKNKDKRAVGTELLTSLEVGFKGQQITTKNLYPPGTEKDVAVRLLDKAFDTASKMGEEKLALLGKNWPQIFYIYMNGLDMCRRALEAERKFGLLENYVFAWKGLDYQADETLRTYLKTYINTATNLRKFNEKRAPDSIAPINRKSYIDIINELDPTPLPEENGMSHPMDIQWGGISMREIKQMPKGTERDKKVLNFCSEIPRGDIFWREVASAAFFTEVQQHNPEDPFEEHAKDFQAYAGQAFVHSLLLYKEVNPVNLDQFLTKYDESAFSKFGLAIAALIAPPSGREEDMRIFTGITAPTSKTFQSLSPYVRNIWTYLLAGSEIRNKHKARKQTPVDHLEQIVLKAVQATAIQKESFYGLKRYPEREPNEHIKKLGPRAQIFRADALAEFFVNPTMQVLQIDVPKSHFSSTYGFEQLTVSKEAENENLSLSLQLLTKKQNPITAEITEEGFIRNCSWTLPDHDNTVDYLVDLAILGLTLNKEPSDTWKYSQVVILQAYANDSHFPDFGIATNIEETKRHIRRLEGEDPKSVLKRRGLTQLLVQLYPETIPPTVPFGQKAIFDLMQKVKRKGEDT